VTSLTPKEPQPQSGTDISIRRARSSDGEFAYHALLTTMREYVELTWGAWLEEEARASIASDASTGRSQIIELASVPVGLLCVDTFATHLQLDQLCIFPEYQRRGIGTQVLCFVLADAGTRGLPLRLRVLRVNPAKRFYERHGFRVVSETPERFFMEHRTTHVP
jgi:ribosomal protein S18 acetylase RimI-like enzyme